MLDDALAVTKNLCLMQKSQANVKRAYGMELYRSTGIPVYVGIVSEFVWESK
jgi:hypothetical protein